MEFFANSGKNEWMDEHRNQGQFQNRNRHNRFHRHGGGHGGGQNRGRSQRPLLTSAINAGGLTLVALVLAVISLKEQMAVVQYLGWAVSLFGLSAIVSYVAQRVKPSFVEKISDYMFLAGVVLMIYVAIELSGIFVTM